MNKPKSLSSKKGNVPSRIHKHQLNTATYKIIKVAIAQKQDLSDLLNNVKDADLLKYNESDHRTLLFHCIDTPNSPGTTQVILEIFKRVKNDLNKMRKITNYGMKPPVISIKSSQNIKDKTNNKIGFSPLMKGLQSLRKDNNLNNIKSFEYAQCVLLLIISNVNVDCIALVEPNKLKKNVNSRDYQSIHPISIAYKLIKYILFLLF